jgi:thiamine biosynthesis lipoprotein
MALATSGDYRSFYTLGEQRLSHTIDPRTGRPIENALASVTVLAPDCMSADALATAFTVMGMKRALYLAQREGIAAFLIARQGKNGFIDSATPRFQQWSQTGVSR